MSVFPLLHSAAARSKSAGPTNCLCGATQFTYTLGCFHGRTAWLLRSTVFFNRLAFLKPFIHLNMWRAFKVSLSSRQNGTCSSTDQPARRSCVCGRRSRHFSSNLKKRNPKRLRTNKYFLNYGETYFFAGIGFSGPPKQQITAASARCVPDGCISFCLLCLPVFLKTFGAPE